MRDGKISPAVDAATILFVRDGADGRIEVFMVVRHQAMDFASGALVFPGGKVAEGDRDPALAGLCRGGEGLSPRECQLRLAAIREAFEETGLLLARRGRDHYLTDEEAAELDPFRKPLDKGELPLRRFLEDHGLSLDFGDLAYFAHWITPELQRRRFDTHFFLARAPDGQTGIHDGHELVDSVWINPADAIAAGKRKEYAIMFPTRMNLWVLAQSETVDDAMAAARARQVVTVLPQVELVEGVEMLQIPASAGYPLTSIEFAKANHD